MGSIACQFCHHILDDDVPICRGNTKFHHIIFADDVSVPMGDTTWESHDSTITISIDGGLMVLIPGGGTGAVANQSSSAT
jgi:hypothetical protein